jgi:hypothetical protein
MPVDPPVPATLKRGHWRDVWDRPSLDMKVRPDKIEMDVSRRDLLIPAGPGVPKMFALTFVAGVSITILYVFLPLLILVLATGVGFASVWFWGTLAAVAVVCWLTLFTLAIRESIADRRYADSL